MYFLPRCNRFYLWALQVKPLYHYASTMLFFILIGIVVSYHYARLNNAIFNQQHQISELYRKIDLITVSNKECLKLRDSLTDEQHQLNTLKKNCKDGFCFPLLFIADLVTKSGTKLNSCCTNGSCDNSWYCQQEVCITLNGTFNQIQKLFDQLHASQKMIECKKLLLKKKEKNSFSCTCSLLCALLK